LSAILDFYKFKFSCARYFHFLLQFFMMAAVRRVGFVIRLCGLFESTTHEGYCLFTPILGGFWGKNGTENGNFCSFIPFGMQ